jgi:hypothetical protein
MDLHGPEPQTDREYLIRIYAAVQDLAAKVTVQNGRIAKLERWQLVAQARMTLVAGILATVGSTITYALLRAWHIVP